MNIFKRVGVVMYLLQRYKADLSFTPMSNATGSCQYTYCTTRVGDKERLTKLTNLKVYTDWSSEDAMSIFLHEIGHLANYKRALLHKHCADKTFNTIRGERRASLWAIRVARLFKLNEQEVKNTLCRYFESYITHFQYRKNLLDRQPLYQGLADVSYEAVKLFGVKYE